MTLATRKSLENIHDDCEFYPHQVDGIRQLARMSSFLLADEPGLGKSLQALVVFAIDVARGTAKKLLVVAPATLMGNWMDEIEKHTDFKAEVLQGTPDARVAQIANFKDSDAHILVVNYEKVPGHYEHLNAVGFDMVVYDEAHAIKNYKSKRTKACQALHAPRHGLLTGTPLMNDVRDLWSLLYRIAPHEFPKFWTFSQRYVVFGGYNNKTAIGIKNEKELKDKLHKYMVRRRKEDVLDLPDKQRITIKVDLDPHQKKLYKLIKDDYTQVVPPKQNEDGEDLEANAMTRFLYLKQVCGTTACFEGYGDYSMKLDRAEELVEELGANGHHIVIFTQFREVLSAMQNRLNTLGAPTFVLHGGIPIADRQGVVRAWSAHPRPAVMLAMLQVAGVGLTMTKARHCIFLDKLFVPALNEQAEDRLHRIGADTTQPVQIYELLCRGTIETRIEAILRQKSEIFGAIVNESDFKRKLIAALAEEEDEDE